MPEPLGALRPMLLEQRLLCGHRFRVARWTVEGASRPLLFFTGIGANAELLAPFLERMRRDVVTFDMPGIGGSEVWSTPYRLRTLAIAAKELLGALGYEEVDVMGVSWGGMLAQEFAYRHPQIVNRLILAATSPGIPMVPGRLSTLFKMISGKRYADAATIETYLQTLYGGSSRNLKTYASRIQSPNPIGYLHQILAIMGWTSARKLTQVDRETLILMGEDDRLVPHANGKILKFLLPNAELQVIEGAGHLFVLTHRDRVLKCVDAFLSAPVKPTERWNDRVLDPAATG